MFCVKRFADQLEIYGHLNFHDLVVSRNRLIQKRMAVFSQVVSYRHVS